MKENQYTRELRCNMCGGPLGAIQDNGLTKYRKCLACGYDWAEKYWDWLEDMEGGAQ